MKVFVKLLESNNYNAKVLVIVDRPEGMAHRCLSVDLHGTVEFEIPDPEPDEMLIPDVFIDEDLWDVSPDDVEKEEFFATDPPMPDQEGAG